MTNTNRAKEKTPAVQAGQTHAAPIRNAGGTGEEMGHFGCTGYSLDTPARTAAITALVQAMQASVYARSSICGLLGWGGEFRPNFVPVGRAQVLAGDGAVSGLLNGYAVHRLGRRASGSPVADG